VIKFVSDFKTDQWFSPGASVSSANKTNHHDKNYRLADANDIDENCQFGVLKHQ
jgi:hypothetical protein